ncbi:hypothetical protein ACTFIT_006342 [Dictyostelium discoideum]
MDTKIKLFLAIVIVAFLIGISTIFSFEGTNKIDAHTIPEKWKNVIQKKDNTNNNNNNNNNINNNNINNTIETGNPYNKIDEVYYQNEKLNIKRSEQVRGAMKHAWEKYKEFAWGQDELRPLTKSHKEWFGLGLTIIDSLDTLKIMNLDKEYKEGRDWVANVLKQSKNTGMAVSVFETIIRVLGSHVTMYGLTNDEMYLEKAVEIGDLLLYAFPKDTKNPFPASQIRLATHGKTYPGWTGGCVILSEVSTLFLEFNELSRISGDPKYKEYSDRVIDALSKLKPNIPGLFPVFVNQDANGFCGSFITIGGLGDSYYEYLLKMWIYTNGEDEIYRRLFVESADSIIEHLYKVSPKGDGYLSAMDHNSLTNIQEHLACFAGGMFALAAAANITQDDKKSAKYMEVGEMITKTCVKTYLTSPSGLAPESFRVDPDSGNISWNVHGTYSWYILRPETVESLFILYRLTGDIKYQEWSWKIFEAIEDVCRHENGYNGLKNVDDRKSLDDTQEIIPLDKYIFNTEAHPILIPKK